MKEDYFAQEENAVRKGFDLEAVIAFQRKHDTQIIRGEDWSYGCWIDKQCYTHALTPMYALMTGIEIFNSRQNDKQDSTLAITPRLVL